jgi:hypothetical protein
MDGVAPPTLEPEELGEAISHAQHELERAVREGGLSKDPMRLPLGALAVTLGAMHKLFVATVEQFRMTARTLDQRTAEMARQPIDPAAQAEMLRQVIAAAAAGANKEAARLARTHNRRTLLMGALTLFGVAGVATGGGYIWGQARAEANIQMTTVELATAFRDGPAAARSWLELMRNNDVQVALQHCTGQATWTDQGRQACALPIWLNTAAAEPPRKP